MEFLCEILQDENLRSEFILGIGIGFAVTFIILLFAMLIANEEGYFDQPNPKKTN